MLAVFVGGYLMAGGANAVNMYMDRDIDDRMARTRLRPIPSGRMRAEAVLAFGVLCATTATFLLAHVANVLTAALALGGFYTYVFVYTRWLKRSSPQNIVIGGAAGAFPPLVGVGGGDGTHRPARRLPLPHHLLLDAAALLGARAAQAARLRPRRRADGAARVGRARDDAQHALVHADPHPAHAAARGVRRARRAVPRHGGAARRWLLVGVVRVMRATEFAKPAWSVYKFSLLYLALLFAAMVVDRAVA